MNKELSAFAARLRGLIGQYELPSGEQSLQQHFDALALELFALQFQYNPVYRKICEARQLTPATVRYWAQVPFVPTSAFKELEFSCIPAGEHTAVFHSSGTTEQIPSRHFHSAESLALYETSLWEWFKVHFSGENQFIFLTPDQAAAPFSSLVHMFETVQKKTAAGSAEFLGGTAADGGWTIDFEAVVRRLGSAAGGKTFNILGTAFSFVHLLDYLAEKGLRFTLPGGSRVMETGGYKNRSRVLPKSGLHALITEYLGVPAQNIICEYGMSELSSQAYDHGVDHRFHFPPWARAQIVSPETGHEVEEGETGIVRIFDLANAYSVAAIQTEDLVVRRGGGFELLGRAQLAEPRGCSLMTA